MFGIGTGEIIIIIVLAVLIFGPKKLPEFAKTAGKFISNLRKTTDDLKRNLEEEIGIDDIKDLHPRRMADRYFDGSEISDIHPGRYDDNASFSEDDPYEEAEKDEEKADNIDSTQEKNKDEAEK